MTKWLPTLITALVILIIIIPILIWAVIREYKDKKKEEK